jgi:hypothetical protein
MKMGLPAEAVAGLQDLGPLQCIIVVNQPAFLVVQGNKWFDNLHIVPVRDVVTPGLAAISIASETYDSFIATNVFITNMTIQGEGSRTVRALEISGQRDLTYEVYLQANDHAVLVQGVLLYHSPWRVHHSECSFWKVRSYLQIPCFAASADLIPPILISQESYATFHSCTFEDINLPVEVFDVSFGGLVRLQDCMFRDVQTPKLVSTTFNDYLECGNLGRWGVSGAFRYRPGDDMLYDIQKEPLPDRPGEYFVKYETLSDCLRPIFRCIDPGYFPWLPWEGCPDQSVERSLNLLANRCNVDYILAGRRGTAPPFAYDPTSDFGDKDYSTDAHETAQPSSPEHDAPDPADAAAHSPYAANLSEYYDCHESLDVRQKTGYRFGFPSEDHIWLRLVRQVRASAPKRPAITAASACATDMVCTVMSSYNIVQKLPVHSAEGRGTWSWPNLPASERQQRVSGQAAPQGPQPPRSSLARPEAAVGIALACAGLLLAAALALVVVRRRGRAHAATYPGGPPSRHAAAASMQAANDESVRSVPPIADLQLSECEVELGATRAHTRQWPQQAALCCRCWASPGAQNVAAEPLQRPPGTYGLAAQLHSPGP